MDSTPELPWGLNESWPCAGGISTANVLGKQLRDVTGCLRGYVCGLSASSQFCRFARPPKASSLEMDKRE